jgi:hypothetical protein
VTDDTDRVRIPGIVLALTPILVCLALLGAIAVWGDTVRMRLRRRGPTPSIPPLEEVAADLRRLRADVIRLEGASEATPHRRARLMAVRSAYQDSLLIACRALEVPVRRAELSRTPAAEVHRLETALRDRGLDVSPTAIR